MTFIVALQGKSWFFIGKIKESSRTKEQKKYMATVHVRAVLWVFRPHPATDSVNIRPPIPLVSGH